MCTCGTDFCNSRMGAQEMMARWYLQCTIVTPSRWHFVVRAEFGVTGVGRHCKSCSGPGGRCQDRGDGGVGLDCGEGVTTCTLALNSEWHLMMYTDTWWWSLLDVTGGWARGCGAPGLGLSQEDSPECALDPATNWTVCWCGEDDCNSLDKTEYLMRFVPTTTTTTTSTTTTTTSTSTTTTTTTITLAKKPLFQPTFVFSSSNSPEYFTSTTASVK